MAPLSKRGFGPPLIQYVFHLLQVSVLCFSCTKIHDRADQKLFWRGRNIFGRARCLVRFLPPKRFAPPHITAQVSPRGRTGNRTVTQLRQPLLVEGRPNCTRQSLASTLSAPCVAATSYCDPGHHANVITPCFLTPCLNVP